MKIFSDPKLLTLGVVNGTVSRHAGNMQEAARQTAFFNQIGVPPQKILHLHQTHSDTIISVLTAQDAFSLQENAPQNADGWVLRPRGWGAAIQTADCVPLFLWNEKADVVGLSHCGWRGVVQGLPGKTVREMKKAGARGRICAWAGPHIQSCCFEVQQDTASQFRTECVLEKNGKLFVDLNAEIIHQLQAEGLEPADVRTPYYCTCGDKENFFSWRRDHIRQNMLSFIYKP